MGEEYKISDYIRILQRGLKELGDVPLIVRTKNYNEPFITTDASVPNESLTWFADGYAVLHLIDLNKKKGK